MSNQKLAKLTEKYILNKAEFDRLYDIYVHATGNNKQVIKRHMDLCENAVISTVLYPYYRDPITGNIKVHSRK